MCRLQHQVSIDACGSIDMSAYNGMTDYVQTCAVLASYLALLYNDTSHGRIRERLAQCLLC